jgi:SET domain-containing protein
MLVDLLKNIKSVFLGNKKSTISYLNSTTFCRLGVTPHGVGVVAIRDIPKGTLLTDYTYVQALKKKNIRDVQIKLKHLDLLLPEVKDLILDRTVLLNNHHKNGKLRTIPPNYNQVLQMYMNNSDSPNSDGVYAILDIKKGEEITENYNAFDMHPISREHFKDFLTER